MYVYIHSETSPEGFWLWTVGHYDPDGTWIPESDHDSSEAAADRVAYLNGLSPRQESSAAAMTAADRI